MTKSMGCVKMLFTLTYIAINNSTGFIVTFNIMLFYVCALETMSLDLYQN